MSQRVIAKQIEFTAWRYQGDAAQVPDWLRPHVLAHSVMSLTVLTPVGEYLVPSGGWVLLGADGKVGVCSAAEFAQRYQTLSADVASVQLAVHATGMFSPEAWNDSIVERAAVAFHNATEQPGWMPWANTSDAVKSATRLAIRHALTAAISLGNRRTLP
jgi:hypothetical protein